MPICILHNGMRHKETDKNYIWDLCQLPRLTFLGHKMKTSPDSSHRILEINYKSLQCLMWISSNYLKNDPSSITMSKNLPYYNAKFKIKCLPAPHCLGRRCRLFPCRASSSISNGTAWQARLLQIVVYHCPYISFYRTATKNNALLNQWGTSVFNLLNFLLFNQKQRMNLTWGLTPIKRYTLIAVTNAENIFHRNWKQQM